MCEALLIKYCADKNNATYDPGCYMALRSGQNWGDARRLRFDCQDEDCFGQYNNYGAPGSNLTCADSSSPPFQTKEQLADVYGAPFVFTSRADMHLQSSVCNRIECNVNAVQIINGNKLWIPAEIVITIIFTLEFVARVAIADSFVRYLADAMNIFDILAILPFYVEICSAKNR